jgi:hypothetical protein
MLKNILNTVKKYSSFVTLIECRRIIRQTKTKSMKTKDMHLTYECYKNKVLMLSTGADIHKVTGMIGTMLSCIWCIEKRKNTNAKFYADLFYEIMRKMDQIIADNKDYGYYYAKGFKKF